MRRRQTREVSLELGPKCYDGHGSGTSQVQMDGMCWSPIYRYGKQKDMMMSHGLVLMSLECDPRRYEQAGAVFRRGASRW